MQHLVHIWQLIVRHESLFCRARASFVPQMVNGLQRIGLANNTTAENRRLAVDLAAMVILWDERRANREQRSFVEGGDHGGAGASAGSKRPRDNDQDGRGLKSAKASTNSAPGSEVQCVATEWKETNRDDREEEDDDFRPSRPLCEIIVNFIARVAFAPQDLQERVLIAERCFILLDQALNLWPDIPVKLSHLEKVLESSVPPKKPSLSPSTKSQENSPGTTSVPGQDRSSDATKPEAASTDKNNSRATAIQTALQICMVFITHQGISFVETNFPAIRAIIRPCFELEEPAKVSNFSDFLIRFSEVCPRFAESSTTKGGLELASADEPSSSAGDEGNKESDQKREGSSSINVPISSVYAALDVALDTAVRSNDRNLLWNALYVGLKLESRFPSYAKVMMEPLVKTVLLRLVKEAIAAREVSRSNGGTDRSPPRDPVTYTGSNTREVEWPPPVVMCLSLLSRWTLDLGDTKKQFLQVLWNLVDKCQDYRVLREIIRIVSEWVVIDEASNVTEVLATKEKIQFLLKMTMFEKLASPEGDIVLRSYLDLVLCLFNGTYEGGTPGQPSGLASKLEKAFIVGLQCRFPDLREEFFRLFEKEAGVTALDRLTFSLAKHGWEPPAESFWITHGVELLLGTCSATPTSLRCGRTLFKLIQVTDEEANSNAPSGLGGFNEYLRRKNHPEELLLFLRRVVNQDELSARHLWLQLFPVIWCSLKDDEKKAKIEAALFKCLSKDHHGAKPTLILQTLLRGLLAIPVEKAPEVPLPLLVFLSKGWNTSHLCIELIERSLRSQRSLDGSKEREDAIDTLAMLYHHLNERDMYFGSWLSIAKAPQTKKALLVEQRGQIEEAQDQYFECLSKGLTDQGDDIPSREKHLWEERWIHCAKALGQWDVLAEFSRTVVHGELLHECLWRIPEWSALKELLAKQPIEDGPQLKIYQGFIHLQENKADTCEQVVRQGVEKALDSWNKICSFPPTQACLPVIHQFQGFVELQESIRLLAELNACMKGDSSSEKSVENIRHILAIWKERLPNRWEEPLIWSNILRWRNHMNSVIVNMLQGLREDNGREFAQTLLALGAKEAAWNTNTLSRVSRKHGMSPLAIENTQKTYTFHTMDVEEYFRKTVETSKAFLNRANSTNYSMQAGLNIINGCNLESFSVGQKAKLFAIKGDFYRRMGYFEDANQAYSRALATAGDSGSSWLAWFLHCDRVQQENGGDTGWTESAMNCLFMAIRFGNRKARHLLGRALYLLAMDGKRRPMPEIPDGEGSAPAEKRVCGVFDVFLDLIPVWVWLPWISQLIGALSRTEASRARAILVRISQHYPQAIFFPLRAFLEERRSIDKPSKNLTGEVIHANRPPVKPYPPSLSQQISPQNTQTALNQATVALNAVRQRAASAAAQVSVAHQALQGFTAGTNQFNQARASLERHETLAAQAQRALQEHTEKFQQAQAKHHQQQERQGGAAADVDVKSVLFAQQSHRVVATNPYEHGDVVMAWLAKSNCPIYVDLERFAAEMSSKMKPHPEEQLLGLTNALLHQSFRLPIHASMEAAPSLRSALEEVSKMCFGTNRGDPSSPPPLPLPTTAPTGLPPSQPLVPRVAASVADLKEDFEAELAPQTAKDFPKSIAEFIVRLRRWKGIFQRRVEAMQRVQNLESISRHLVEIRNSDLELFGQYLDIDSEPSSELLLRIQCISSDVQIIRRPVGAGRKLEVICSDGSRHFFLFETSVNAASQRTEERTVQLIRLLNMAFVKNVGSHQRRLCVEVPTMIPTGQHTRLVSDNSLSISTSELLESFLARRGQTIEDPLLKFRKQCVEETSNSANLSTTQDASSSGSREGASRRPVFDGICRDIPDTILRDWLVSLFLDPSVLFVARHRLARSFAVSSMVVYLLAIGSRRPHNMFISYTTGQVIHAHWRPTIQPRTGFFENEEPVPFRLSRNWTCLMDFPGLRGVMIGSMMAALEAFQADPYLLESQFLAVMRDELMSWSSTKDGAKQLSASGAAMAPPRGVEGDAFETRLIESVKRVMTRATNPVSTDDDSDPIVQKIEDLVHLAESPSLLCQMDPSWHPWF